MDTSTLKSHFTEAHETAWRTVTEDESLPQIDVLVLISFISDMFAKNRSDVMSDYIHRYGPLFTTYTSVLSEEFFTGLIQDALENSDREEFQNMAKDDVATCLVRTSEAVLSLVAAYLSKQITDTVFLERMCCTGIDELAKRVINAFGLEGGLHFTGAVLAYQGAMGAFKEYTKALEDLRIARERRIQVEEACRQSIEMIRNYRIQAEQYVSTYMNAHLDVFEQGFAAMDRAILANDVDGYIAGNVESQKILGAEIQFTNQDEFEAFMESDESFIF